MNQWCCCVYKAVCLSGKNQAYKQKLSKRAHKVPLLFIFRAKLVLHIVTYARCTHDIYDAGYSFHFSKTVSTILNSKKFLGGGGEHTPRPPRDSGASLKY